MGGIRRGQRGQHLSPAVAAREAQKQEEAAKKRAEEEQRRAEEEERKKALEERAMTPQGVVQTDEEMNAANVLEAKNNLYSKSTDASDKVRAIVLAIGAELAEVGNKPRLNDPQQVHRTILRYIKSSYESGVLPSRKGLARAFGLTSRALDRYIAEHPGSPTVQLLDMASDAFAEMLSTAAISGGVQPIVSIFLLKSQYGYRDNAPQAVQQNDPFGSLPDASTLQQKYAELAPDETGK